MAIYFVDFVHGLDANNGLGPDASHATNKPWKTLAKLLGAAGMASGDTAYLSPAGPFREVVTVAMTSAVAETQIVGDPYNFQGFKTSGGVLVAAGEVQWTGYTTNDTTAPAGNCTLTLSARDFLTFKFIAIVGGNASPSCVDGTAATSTNIKFESCAFNPFQARVAINHTSAANTASNWTFDKCRGLANSTAFIQLTLTRHTADYDVNIQIKNCLITGGPGGAGIAITSTGAGVGFGGGVDAFNTTIIGMSSGMQTQNANLSTSIPCTFYNGAIRGSVGLNANTAGQIVENYNVIDCGTARTNVTAGANSKSDGSYPFMVHFGQELIWGGEVRPFGMPTNGSPLLGFGAQAGGPTDDILGITRPAGGASTSYAVGAFERHDTAVQETSTVDAGSSGLKIVGPGDQEIEVPVDASATVITVRVRYDTNHATTNKPQAVLLDNGELGVTTETKTAAAAVDTWETLTFSSFTPSKKGVVKIRLVSRSAAGNGIAYFDTFTGGAQDTQGMDYFSRTEPFRAAVATSAGGGLIRHPGMSGGLNG